MYSNYHEIIEEIKTHPLIRISVAVAQDKGVLEAVKLAQEVGIAEAVLVGDATLIAPLMEEVGLSADTPILHEEDSSKAAIQAVSLVKEGQAQVLMKGLVNSSDFLRAVLQKGEGLRTGRLLSHLGAFEIPGQKKLLFITDGGMNIAPTLFEKKQILVNAIFALHGMGIMVPNVALLTANEIVNEKMPATLDAKILVEMRSKGDLPVSLLEGPIALDVAVSQKAAQHKGIESKIAGNVDLIMVPNIETGNALGKSLIYFAKSKMAGIVLGATHPIIMTSRSETPEGKMNSIALACLIKLLG